MTEPTIICPNCKTEIKLTESLAATLIESTRLDYERRFAQKDEEIFHTLKQYLKLLQRIREYNEDDCKATIVVKDEVMGLM